MKSKILQKEKDELVKLYKSMSPEQRLAAFFNHSFLMYHLAQAGISYRKGNSQSSRNNNSEGKMI